MACTICGKEGPVNDSGFCEECAAKLKSYSQASSTFAKAAESARGEPSAAPGEDRSAASMSRIVAEFGQSEKLRLRNPFSVSIAASGNVVVMDRPEKGKYRVATFAEDGEYIRTLLECGQGSGATELQYPKGIAIDVRGNIYIPDAGNDRIQRFDPQGAPLGPIGAQGDGPGEFSFPCDIEIDDVGALYVADTYNCRIQKLTPQGMLLLCIGGQGDGGEEGGELDEPLGVAVDKDRNILVADTNHHRIVKYNPQGQQVLAFGKEGTGRGELTCPSDVRVTADGMIYVADQDNSRVQRFDPAGMVLAEFALEEGTPGGGGGGDVAVDADGCLLICNPIKHTVVRVELFDLLRRPAGEPA